MWCQASLTSPVRPTRNTRRASVHVMRGIHVKAYIVTLPPALKRRLSLGANDYIVKRKW